jgi:hypothetical protein
MNKRLLLTLLCIVVAFVVRMIAPRTTWFVAWGWPLGSHYVRLAWVGSWVLLVAGLIVGVIALFKIVR